MPFESKALAKSGAQLDVGICATTGPSDRRGDLTDVTGAEVRLTSRNHRECEDTSMDVPSNDALRP